MNTYQESTFENTPENIPLGNIRSELPNLLEETPRPSQKLLNKFCSHLNRWRFYLFGLWEEASEIISKPNAVAIDQLVGMVFLLDYCRQTEEPNVRLITVANSMETVSLHELQQRIADSFSCPILRAVLEFKTTADIIIPKALFQKNWERSLRSEIVFLFGAKEMPLWFFGDYHQFCVANPPQNGARRQRTSAMRYSRGINYTPAPLVNYLTTTCIDAALEKNDLNKIRLIDPTCGCALFLIAAFRYLAQKQACSGQQILDLLKQSIFGGDIDEGAVAWSVRLLLLAAKQMIDGNSQLDSSQLTVPDMQENIRLGSFLDVYKDSESFNVMLGGPPFVRFSEMKRSQPREVARYQNEFKSAQHGLFDLYMLILEKSIRLLSESGELGYSVSNTFMRSESGKAIRQIIDEETHIRELIEFEDKAIYPGAATQIVLLRLSKGEPVTTRYVHIDGKKTHKAGLESIYGQNPDKQGIEIRYPSKKVFSKKWNLRPAKERSGIPISGLRIKIFQGISPPLDRFFMLEDRGVLYPRFAYGVTRDGEKVKLEREMLRPIIRGRNTTGFVGASGKNVMIFPYTEDHQIITEEVLREKYPLTYEYLEGVRPKVKTKNRSPWYKFPVDDVHPFSPNQIICSKITGARGFSFREKPEALLHTGIFGCDLDSRFNPHVMLAILNSSVFWDYVIAKMPTYGDGCRGIRIPTFKDFVLPKSIWNTPVNAIEDAENLVSEIKRSLLKRQQDKFRDLCKDLDHYVEQLYHI